MPFLDDGQELNDVRMYFRKPLYQRIKNPPMFSEDFLFLIG